MLRIKRLIKSFSYAGSGLIKVFKEEYNLKLQLSAAFISVLFGFFFRISPWEWAVIILAIGLVLVMETINSAVERITDVLKPRINDFVMEIKDIMAAAVMLSAIVSVIVGLIVFSPHVINLVLSWQLFKNQV